MATTFHPPWWLDQQTWVVVADSCEAHAYRLDMPEGRLTEVAKIDATPPPEPADRPGRSFESGSAERHAYTSRTTPKDHAQQVFSQEVSRWLTQHHQDKAFSHLVVAAPPRFLGQLRHDYDSHVKDVVRLEIPADLIGMAEPQLKEHLLEHGRA